MCEQFYDVSSLVQKTRFFLPETSIALHLKIEQKVGWDFILGIWHETKSSDHQF